MATEDSDLDEMHIEVRGSASYQFASGFGMQADIEFNRQTLDFFDSSVERLRHTSVDGALHAFYRSEVGLVGIFAQYGISEIGPAVDNWRYDDYDRAYIGADLQYFHGNTTFYLQGGWQRYELASLSSLAGDYGFEGFFLNGAARYFVTDNLKLEVNAGYEHVDVGWDVDTLKTGGSAEYRFDTTPLSTFLNVEYRNNDFDGQTWTAERADLRVLAGLKLNFGSQTLLERDRYGASLNPMRTGPMGGSILTID